DAGDALAQLDDRGVVLRVRAGRHLHVDVAELRIRTQQLAARDLRLVRELAGGRDAEERVRHVGQRVVGRQALVLRIDLVDVDVAGGRSGVRARPAQIGAGEAGVAEGDAHPARQLALQVDRVLLHARRAAVRVDEVDVAARAGEEAEVVAGWLHEAVRKRVADRDRRYARRHLWHAGLRRVAGLAPRGGAGGREVPRRVVEAPSAAEHGLVVEAVDRAGAGRRLDGRLIALRRRCAVDAGEDQAAEDLAARAGDRVEHADLAVERADGRLIEADRGLVVLLLKPALVLEAQAVVDGQLVGHAPVILGVARRVADEAVELRVERHVARVLRVAEQEIGEGVVAEGAREVVGAGRGAVIQR